MFSSNLTIFFLAKTAKSHLFKTNFKKTCHDKDVSQDLMHLGIGITAYIYVNFMIFQNKVLKTYFVQIHVQQQEGIAINEMIHNACHKTQGT